MFLIYVAAWVAIVCWAISNWMNAPGRARGFWTVGCLANLTHILLAFHLVHAWDQRAAYADVAAKTFEAVGVNSGVGVYVNYCFSLFWLLDTAYWWLSPLRRKLRSVRRDAAVQFIFLFMFFNATVVFGGMNARLPGGLICALGAIGWIRGRRAKNSAALTS